MAQEPSVQPRAIGMVRQRWPMVWRFDNKSWAVSMCRQIETNSNRYMKARTWVNQAECGIPSIHTMVKGSHHDSEHIIEMQMIPTFFQYATMGDLVSGRSATFAPVACEMFLPVVQGGQDIMQMSLLPRRHDLFSGDESRTSSQQQAGI